MMRTGHLLEGIGPVTYHDLSCFPLGGLDQTPKLSFAEGMERDSLSDGTKGGFGFAADDG